MHKRILITGCAGFIGSNLTHHCLREGWDVYGVDDMSRGRIDFLPRAFAEDSGRFIRSDFSSAGVLNLISKHNFDAVVHLAAIPRISFSVEHPVLTNDVNVSRTLALMQGCRDNIGRFVFSSSSSVYGGADVLPTPTTYPKDPKSPYALQKSVIEDYMTLYSRLYRLDTVSLRFFNVFGPHQLGSSPYSTAVSAWLNAVLRGESMRSDGDGTQSRDMCYIDNVVDACVRAVVHDRRLDGVRLNVACGDRTSNRQVLDHLLTRYPGSRYHEAPWRVGDVMHTQADITDTTRILGYVPLVKFWEGLERTIEWYERSWNDIKGM